MALLIALVLSYALGIIIWTLTFRTGIITYNYSNLINLATLFLPEITGIIIGTVIIKKLQKTSWKTALVAMTAAMLTSLLTGMLLAYINLTITTSL